MKGAAIIGVKGLIGHKSGCTVAGTLGEPVRKLPLRTLPEKERKANENNRNPLKD